ncbi:hypothetical protein FI667_g2568, partial [Globisporangium splendens]
MSDPSITSSYIGEAPHKPTCTEKVCNSQLFGFAVGKFVCKTLPKILYALLIVFVVFVVFSLFVTLVDAEVREADASVLTATAMYANKLRHYNCKRRGGCSRKCPYITNDDPRKVMGVQIDGMDSLYNATVDTLQKEKDSMDNLIIFITFDLAFYRTDSLGTSCLYREYKYHDDNRQSTAKIIGKGRIY